MDDFPLPELPAQSPRPGASPPAPPSIATASPPAATSPRRRLYVTLAQYAWISVLLCVSANLFLFPHIEEHWPRQAAMILTSVLGALLVTGVAGGVIALCGIRRHGRRGLLWPAVIGISLWGLIGASMVTALNFMREYSAQQLQARFHPAIRTPGGLRIENAEIGYAFDAPPGFVHADRAGVDASVLEFLILETPDQPNLVLVVKTMGRALSMRPLPRSAFPPNENLAVMTVDWRGLRVTGIRLVEFIERERHVTYSAILPLHPVSIQVSATAPATEESRTILALAAVVRSLEGTPNW